MAGIITGMEKPKRCYECDLCDIDGWCRPLKQTTITEENLKTLNNTCPLKSVEGLIEKIKDAKPAYNRILDTLEEKRFEVGMIAGIDKAIEIIKEYCGIDKE